MGLQGIRIKEKLWTENSTFGTFTFHSEILRKRPELVQETRELFDKAFSIVSDIMEENVETRIQVFFLPAGANPLDGLHGGYGFFGGGNVTIRSDFIFGLADPEGHMDLLLHEMAHSFTPHIGARLPDLWTEGIAEVIAWETISRLGYSDEMYAIRHRTIEAINATALDQVYLWDWEDLPKATIDWNHYSAAFILDYMVKQYGMSIIPKLHRHIETANVRLDGSLEESERYSLLDSALLNATRVSLAALIDQLPTILNDALTSASTIREVKRFIAANNSSAFLRPLPDFSKAIAHLDTATHSFRDADYPSSLELAENAREEAVQAVSDSDTRSKQNVTVLFVVIVVLIGLVYYAARRTQ